MGFALVLKVSRTGEKGRRVGLWLGTEGSEDWRKEKSRVVLPWYS